MCHLCSERVDEKALVSTMMVELHKSRLCSWIAVFLMVRKGKRIVHDVEEG